MSNPISNDWVGLIIRRNSLIIRKWIPPIFKDDNSNEIIKDGYYKEKDITDKLPEYLTYNCIIDNGTTLRDFFKLLNKHKKILSVIFHQDYFDEWLTYGLRAPNNSLSNVSSTDEIESDYFEIAPQINHEEFHQYNHDHVCEYTISETEDKVRRKIFSKGFESEESVEYYLEFGMVSKPLTKKDINNSNGAYTEKSIGERINIGFLGSDLATLMDYQLKLKNSICYYKTIFDENDNVYYKEETWMNFFNICLFDIIKAIFFEIAFYGDPKMMQEKSKEVFDLLNKVKKNQ
mgnify:CR=1 FL=1